MTIMTITKNLCFLLMVLSIAIMLVNWWTWKPGPSSCATYIPFKWSTVECISNHWCYRDLLFEKQCDVCPQYRKNGFITFSDSKRVMILGRLCFNQLNAGWKKQKKTYANNRISYYIMAATHLLQVLSLKTAFAFSFLFRRELIRLQHLG